MHIENATGERTAGLVYVRLPFCVRGEYEVPLEETVRIARKYNLPVICDFAAQACRKTHLRMALEKGAHLVVFRGGKDIMGPYNTRVVFGRTDLIEAVKSNSSPHRHITTGRGFKVSKEQVVGFIVALQRFLKIDEEAQLKRDLDLCYHIADQFKDLPHVKAEVYIPDDEIEGMFCEYPQVHLKLDEDALGVKACKVASYLWSEEPRIYLRSLLSPWGLSKSRPMVYKKGKKRL